MLNEFRLRLDRDVYSKIVKKVNKKTQANLKRIYNNLEDLKIFHINGIFIGKLIEFEFILYFNAFFGEFELLKKILQIEDYDKVILFNYNPNFSDFIGYLFSKFKNVEAYQDSLLKSINKRLNWHIFFHLYQIIKNNLIGYIVSKTQKISKKKVNQEKNDIVIFFGYNPKKLNFSPFQAIKPIYDYLKKKKMFSPIFYQQIKNYITLREFCRILKALMQIRNNWIRNEDKILLDLEYDSLKLNGAIKEFNSFETFFKLIIGSINLYHFNQFIKYYYPSLIVTTNEFGIAKRMLLKYCRMKNIPSVFIPLCANIVYDPIITRSDLSYITVAGKKEKDYFIKKGEDYDKIIVTGRPRYENLYTGKISKLTEIKDMISGHVYQFEPKKFTILLTTSLHNQDFKSNEIFISTVIQSLKELNLLNNLILKLHPMQDATVIKKILKKLNTSSIIIRDYNIFEIIKTCDLILSRNSTTVLESMIIGKPVIMLDLINLDFEYTFKYQFEEIKSLIKIKDQKSLTKQLKEFLINPNLLTKYSKILKEEIKDYSFYDEKSNPTEKTVDLFSKVIINSE